MKSESLGEKQRRFTLSVASLIAWAYDNGFELTFGDAFRDPRAFGKQGEAGPYGRRRSAHKHRLAVDLNAFKEGRYLTASEDYKPLGDFWKSLGSDHCWGGDFNDGNHFSLDHAGVR